MKRAAELLGAVAVLSIACQDDSFLAPRGAEQFVPLTAYQTAWQSVERCSGKTGDFTRIRWYVVPAEGFSCENAAQWCVGLWHAPHDIYLTEAVAVDSATSFLAVRHEMLHDLLQTGAHTSEFRACGVLGWMPDAP